MKVTLGDIAERRELEAQEFARKAEAFQIGQFSAKRFKANTNPFKQDNTMIQLQKPAQGSTNPNQPRTE